DHFLDARHFAVEHFERQRLTRENVLGAVNGPHAAGAEHRRDAVFAVDGAANVRVGLDDGMRRRRADPGAIDDRRPRTARFTRYTARGTKPQGVVVRRLTRRAGWHSTSTVTASAGPFKRYRL